MKCLLGLAAALLALLNACSSAPAPAPAPSASESSPAMDWHRDPSELAIERWSAVRGAPSAACADYARSIRFEWVDDGAALTKRCGLGYSVIGCFTVDADGPVALVRGDALANTLVHETMHALEACQTHTVDNAHADHALWAGLMNGDAN